MNTQLTSLPGERIFTVPEVAAYLKISKSKIYSLVSENKIRHVKIGRNLRIRESDLREWLELQTENVPQHFQYLSAEK